MPVFVQCAIFALPSSVGGEGAAMGAFIHLDAVDINVAAGESAGEMHRVGGEDALEGGAAAFRAGASLGSRRVRGLDLAAEDSHGDSFAERNCRCILCLRIS